MAQKENVIQLEETAEIKKILTSIVKTTVEES